MKNYRKGATRKTPTRRKARSRANTYSPMKWIWLITGVLLGGLIVGLTVTKLTNNNLVITKTKVKAKVKTKTIVKAKKPPKFEFYTLLPNGNKTLQIAKKKSAKKTKKTQQPAKNYLLQAGSFRKLADADELKAKLLLSGFSPKISKNTVNNGKIWFRVTMGPYKSKKLARKAQQQLKQQRISGILVLKSKK